MAFKNKGLWPDVWANRGARCCVEQGDVGKRVCVDKKGDGILRWMGKAEFGGGCARTLLSSLPCSHAWQRSHAHSQGRKCFVYSNPHAFPALSATHTHTLPLCGMCPSVRPCIYMHAVYVCTCVRVCVFTQLAGRKAAMYCGVELDTSIGDKGGMLCARTAASHC